MGLSRITELAKEDPGRKFLSIAHLLTPEAMHEAFLMLRRDASAGVDQVTYRDYEKQAEQKIQQLHERLKNKTYRALPLRRIYIPKEDGRQRPISIPALEDKIVQKRQSSCSTPSTSRISWIAPTGSDLDAAHNRRWTKLDGPYAASQLRVS